MSYTVKFYVRDVIYVKRGAIILHIKNLLYAIHLDVFNISFNYRIACEKIILL